MNREEQVVDVEVVEVEEVEEGGDSSGLGGRGEEVARANEERRYGDGFDAGASGAPMTIAGARLLNSITASALHKPPCQRLTSRSAFVQENVLGLHPTSRRFLPN